ncbi:MAG: MarR family transcriptional regulator [Candidatus Thorarchaeota archaeon]
MESHNLTTHQRRILNIIMRYPGINQKELVSRTKINRFKIMRELQILKSLNIIKNTKIENMVCYEYIPDVEMKYRIMKGLMVKFLSNEIDEETFLKLKKRLE